MATTALHAHARDTLVAASNAAVVLVDCDLRITLADGPAFVRLRYDTVGIVGRRLVDVLPAPSWQRLEGPYREALAGGRAEVDVDARGSVHHVVITPLRQDGAVVGAQALSHDVTEQRRLSSLANAQRTVAREHEQLLAGAFDRAPIGMSIIDLDGRWLRVNDAYCEMFGYTRLELASRDATQITHPDDLPEVRVVGAGRDGRGPSLRDRAALPGA